MKLGIVGFGLRGRSLAALAQKSFSITPFAICDALDANLEAAKQAYPSVRLFSTFNQLVDEVQLDALLVETPATSHAALCCQALARNIPVMSDVPAVSTVEEAHTLWRAQQASNGFYMLGANANLWGFADEAVDLVKQGTLGQPYYMEAEYIHDVRAYFETTPWRKTYASIRYCTHSLGPLLRLIDEDLEWVSCFDTGSHINQEEGQHDAMTALFRTRSNVVVRLLTSFINQYPGWGHAYRIYGTNGYFERTRGCAGMGTAKTFHYSPDCHSTKVLHEIACGELPRGANPETADEHGGVDYALLKLFFTAIREGLPSPIPLREALRMTLPGIVAAESAQKGGALMRIQYPWSDPADQESTPRREKQDN